MEIHGQQEQSFLIKQQRLISLWILIRVAIEFDYWTQVNWEHDENANNVQGPSESKVVQVEQFNLGIPSGSFWSRSFWSRSSGLEAESFFVQLNLGEIN